MSGRSRTSPASVELGGEPRVNLLPPEVAQRSRARAMRRALAGLVVAAVLVVGAGYALASLYAADAQSKLEAAQAHTQELLTEQLKYADATTVASLVAATTQARGVATSTEVMWSDLIYSIASYLPAGSTLDSGTLLGEPPWGPPLLPGGPLREGRIATLTIVVKSPTVPDAAVLVRSLSKLPGFADATPDLVEFNGTDYSTTITLNVDQGALSGRFLPDGTQPEVKK
ncbi:MAG: hypothetical protein ABJB03_12840 [Rhodoglobus sp.]